ncbi:SCO1664 family protein [Glutamicibacter sp. JC586]|uniref:SCO1664 family protein n=1 Tax=Glutamicibacter sp. JC586 TaxID=2590552 RepID=UPI00135B866F|nr:SCO1664 family protein [Glutamicibacter sp. JC586]
MTTVDLLPGDLELTGRITTASNATFLGTIGEQSVVYKPVKGEKPLWDFPHQTLANREVAAYLVSQALGWNIVPRSWLRDGPFGTGMVQLWQDVDINQHPVDLVMTKDAPSSGWKNVLTGEDENGQEVSLLHEDTEQLRRMAVFDVLVNNADRKGDHVLAMEDGHRFGVDHGLCFHEEHKLRTVLWGWIGQPLMEEELQEIDRLVEALNSTLGTELAELLSEPEIQAFATRCQVLRGEGHFPAHSGDMPAVPWPLF